MQNKASHKCVLNFFACSFGFSKCLPQNPYTYTSYCINYYYFGPSTIIAYTYRTPSSCTPPVCADTWRPRRRSADRRDSDRWAAAAETTRRCWTGLRRRRETQDKVSQKGRHKSGFHTHRTAPSTLDWWRPGTRCPTPRRCSDGTPCSWTQSTAIWTDSARADGRAPSTRRPRTELRRRSDCDCDISIMIVILPILVWFGLVAQAHRHTKRARTTAQNGIWI